MIDPQCRLVARRSSLTGVEFRRFIPGINLAAARHSGQFGRRLHLGISGMLLPSEVAIAEFPAPAKKWGEMKTKIAPVLLVLFSCWNADAAPAKERITRPKVGETYVFSARLSAVDMKSRTFTVRGSADNRETLLLFVHPRTRLFRAGKRAALENGKIGEHISGTLTLTRSGKAIAMSTTFGAPIPPRSIPGTRVEEVYGLASVGRIRDPIRGNVVTSTISMPTR
jgi:hypothetical protein